MTDHHPSPLQAYRGGRLAVHDATTDGRSVDSYKTGESSKSDPMHRHSLSATTRPTDETLSSYTGDNMSPGRTGSSPPVAASRGDNSREGEWARRKNRQRTAGGFLLHDSVSKGPDNLKAHRQRGVPRSKAKAASQTPQTPTHDVQRQSTIRRDNATSSRDSTESPHSSTPDSKTSGAMERTSTNGSSPQQDSPDILDVDSTQIVHMALNLSESRRMASRRNVSHATPPRLAPLPDGTSGSNLRQHLQQQRRSSRNLSPKPRQNSSPRIPSTAKASSPLQPNLDTGLDGQYRYYFTASTLSRAARAKEQLELMFQYRRLLESLPPLKPRWSDRSAATSPPSSPIAARPPRFGGFVTTPTMGRKYNPLQYIRNRKVRARERKVIDGEKQGFGETSVVRSWVDKVYQKSSITDTLSGVVEWTIPRFPITEEPVEAGSTDSISKPASKVRRPRVDWFIEPCDMIADAYWLEQDNHKHLIEDREWRKIFPSDFDTSRPMSKQAEPNNPVPLNLDMLDDNLDWEGKGTQLAKADTELTHGSTRQRAKEKLHNIKSFPHRHHGLSHDHDIQRGRKGSTSDFSDSESDKKEERRTGRQGRSGTITSDANDLLQKQMMEMIAKEAREKERASADETDHLGPISILTPDRNTASKPTRYMHGRTHSAAESVDFSAQTIAGKPRGPSPPKFGPKLVDSGAESRQTATAGGKMTSPPISPELRPSRGADPQSPTAGPLPPAWSRSGSPTRRPFSKLKSGTREKHGNANTGLQNIETETNGNRQNNAGNLVSPTENGNPARRPTSLEKSATDPPMGMVGGHRRSESMRQRAEDPVGLRGMFKGPRIDTVLRGGVSRIGDIIRKKEGSSESQPDMESTDESDSDVARGRGRVSLSLSRSGSKRHPPRSRRSSRHFLDAMPNFSHTAISPHPTEIERNKEYSKTGIPSEAEPKKRSYDYLKPPKGDVRSSSSSASPPALRNPRLADSDVSESESWQSSNLDFNYNGKNRQSSTPLNELMLAQRNHERRSRQWSIADRNNPCEVGRLSRKDVARVRALILSSGIKAMEVNRRAYEYHRPLSVKEKANNPECQKDMAGIPWADIASIGTGQPQDQQVIFCELHPFAARVLGEAIQSSGQRWQASADHFTSRTSPHLQKRIGGVRSRIEEDLSDMTRKAVDEADETSKDLALDQPLKVKHVVDIIEKMLRKRRRRFRWARRGLWLTVEWALVGFMWYVWFVVMILRVFLGVGKGVLRGMKWLLWL